jgi:hypothetical protein
MLIIIWTYNASNYLLSFGSEIWKESLIVAKSENKLIGSKNFD